MRPSAPVVVALVVLSAFLALLAYGLISRGVDGTIDNALSEGELVASPPLALGVLVDGGDSSIRRAGADGVVSLAELRGRPAVVNFWASWCDPCATEAPDLARAARSSDGVLFLGIDIQDVRADAREFLRDYDLAYPSLRDGSKDTMREWGVTGLPETFFITADGRVAAHVIGAANAQQLRDGIEAARAGRATAPQRGGERRGVE